MPPRRRRRPEPPTFRGATLIQCLQNGPRAAARWAIEAAIPAGSRSAAATGSGCGVAPGVPAGCGGAAWPHEADIWLGRDGGVSVWPPEEVGTRVESSSP